MIVSGQIAAAGTAGSAIYKLGIGYAPPSGGEGTLIVADNVGIGTDWVQDQDIAFFEYLQKDKGTGRFVSPPYKVVPPMPKGISNLSQFQNFVPAMDRAGWSTQRIEKILGLNWFLFFKKIWK